MKVSLIRGSFWLHVNYRVAKIKGLCGRRFSIGSKHECQTLLDSYSSTNLTKPNKVCYQHIRKIAAIKIAYVTSCGLVLT